jgi:hypothetical protein
MIRSRLPREGSSEPQQGLASKFVGGLAAFGKAYWDALPTPTYEKKSDG